LIPEALEILVGALSPHRPERPEAAAIAEGERRDLPLLPGQIPHTLSGLDVDVATGGERLERPHLTGEPSQYTSLDRGVVDHGERTEKHRAHERLESVRAPTEAEGHVERLGGDRVIDRLPEGRLDRRGGEVLQLDPATGPASSVRPEKLEGATEATVVVNAVEGGDVLLRRREGELAAELEGSPVVVGQIVPEEGRGDRLGADVRDLETGVVKPREELGRRPRVSDSGDR